MSKYHYSCSIMLMLIERLGSIVQMRQRTLLIKAFETLKNAGTRKLSKPLQILIIYSLNQLSTIFKKRVKRQMAHCFISIVERSKSEA